MTDGDAGWWLHTVNGMLRYGLQCAIYTCSNKGYVTINNYILIHCIIGIIYILLHILGLRII